MSSSINKCTITDQFGESVEVEAGTSLAAATRALELATAGALEWPLYATLKPYDLIAERYLVNQGVEVKIELKEFTKFDSDKPMYDLVPPSAVKALAEVLTHGAKKYSPNNWRQCKDMSRYVAATMRHFEAYRSGETHDPDSGFPHLWHAMTNIAFLIELDSTGQTDVSGRLKSSDD